MDAVRFPRATRYIRNLPSGLLSYPEYECKASVYREALAVAPKQLDPDGLDPLLVDYVRDPVPMNSWIPEVVNSSLYLAIADQMFASDEAFLDWVGQVSQNVFKSPVYRFLMAVASPDKLARGAERRWQTFHKGTTYEVKVHDWGTEARLEFPEYLFDRLVLRASCRAIQEAYRASGAPGALMELITFSATEAKLRATWYPERQAKTSVT